MTAPASESYPLLAGQTWLRHGFILRVPDLPVHVERNEALALLAQPHRDAIAQLGFSGKRLITAEQVHGCRVVRVAADTEAPVADCDGLLTDDPAIVLGIYTADCGAIYLVDPVQRAWGLLHSGKKGTELGIVAVAIETMHQEFGSEPENLLVQLAPCIRPPHYDVDFAADIGKQARKAGVGQFADCGANTGADLAKYYSYRQELGKTGRHLAVLGHAG